jgi:Protein of unknown function (DUF3179)
MRTDISQGSAAPPRSPLLLTLSLLLLISGCAAALIIFWPAEPPPQPATHRPTKLEMTPFAWPGVRQPPTRPAAEVDVPGDAAVIGVSAGGKHRAYLIQGVERRLPAVVNDLLEDTPVTVTYCEQTGHARVFTADAHGAPLNIGLGGLGKRMLLRLPKGSYWQDDVEPTNAEGEPFPYRDLAFELMSWKRWRELHPDTDIYVGDLPPAAQTTAMPAPMLKPPVGKARE